MNFSHMLVGTSNPVRVAQCGETPWVIESEDRLWLHTFPSSRFYGAPLRSALLW